MQESPNPPDGPRDGEDGGPAPPPPPPPPPQAPGWAPPAVPATSGGCHHCGREPTTHVSLRQQTGMVITRRVERVEGEFCRDCGLAQQRDLQNRTLALGWFGIVSFFTNLGHIAHNLAAGRRLAALAPPHGPAAAGRQAPLDPGRPTFLRLGAAVGGLVGVVVVGLVVAIALDLADDARRDADGAMFTLADATCEPAFAGYVGTPYLDSDLFYDYYLPTAEGWETGDREVICVVFDSDGPLTGSVAGSGR